MVDNPLPVPVPDYAHWRVLIRPTEYMEERLDTLNACLKLVEKTQVRLRGWPYPFLSRHNEKRIYGRNFFGSWAKDAHLEYWRLYQSCQFIQLSAFTEDFDESVKEQLRQTTRSHLDYRRDIDWDLVPGFIDVINTIYSLTEMFEFSSRLCQTGKMGPGIKISISMKNVKNFLLTTSWDRSWFEYYASTEDVLERTQEISVKDLISRSAPLALEAAKWFFERFGWLDAPMEGFESDQKKFLKGLI